MEQGTFPDTSRDRESEDLLTIETERQLFAKAVRPLTDDVESVVDPFLVPFVRVAELGRAAALGRFELRGLELLIAARHWAYVQLRAQWQQWWAQEFATESEEALIRVAASRLERIAAEIGHELVLHAELDTEEDFRRTLDPASWKAFRHALQCQ